MIGGVDDARLLRELRAELVERLRSRQAEIEEALLSYLIDSVPDSAGENDVHFVLGRRDVISACVDAGLLAIEQGDEWLGPTPPIVVVQSRRAVRNGVSLATGLHRYRAAYLVMWDLVLEQILYGETPECHQARLLGEVSVSMTSLLGRLLTDVSQVYCEELRRDQQTSGERLAQMVRKIVAGGHVDERLLNYRFDAEHVGVIGWGDGAANALAGVADRLGYERLIVSNDDGTVWVWMGTTRECVVADVERALRSNARVFAAVGEPAPQLAGFRETHALARGAYLVARLSHQQITRYAEVAREARALQDPLHAKWLMRTYTAPIVRHRDADTLLTTLEKFYETWRNVDKTAKLLGSTRHTVNRRLDKIAEIIGRDLRTSHTEMEVALKLSKLDGEPDGPPAWQRS